MGFYMKRRMSDEQYYLSMANRPQRQDKFSKYRGVTKGSKNYKYRAVLVYKAVRYYLGNFNDEVEAAKAYNEAALRIIGPHAVLNDLSDIKPTHPLQS